MGGLVTNCINFIKQKTTISFLSQHMEVLHSQKCMVTLQPPVAQGTAKVPMDELMRQKESWRT